MKYPWPDLQCAIVVTMQKPIELNLKQYNKSNHDKIQNDVKKATLYLTKEILINAWK